MLEKIIIFYLTSISVLFPDTVIIPDSPAYLGQRWTACSNTNQNNKGKRDSFTTRFISLCRRGVSMIIEPGLLLRSKIKKSGYCRTYRTENRILN